MSGEVETADGSEVETADIDSLVYKYLGPTEDTDVVAALKAHHAEGHDCSPSDLVGRKIASGGNEPETTYVVIIEWSA
jgi:hypothetical protein